MARLGFTPMQQAFIEQYPIDRNGTQAAIRVGVSPKTASMRASKWMSDANIRAAVQERLDKINEEAELTAVEVMRMLKQRATANVANLASIQNDCCRYCYGKDHEYQETPSERKARRKTHDELLRATPQKLWPSLPAFDELGGIGFDPRKPPRDDCPECFGRGVRTSIYKDSRSYTAQDLAIYDGIKETKDGFEIKVASRDAALDKIGRRLNLWRGPGAPPKSEGEGGGTQVDVKVATIVYNAPGQDPRVDDTPDSSESDL